MLRNFYYNGLGNHKVTKVYCAQLNVLVVLRTIGGAGVAGCGKGGTGVTQE